MRLQLDSAQIRFYAGKLPDLKGMLLSAAVNSVIEAFAKEGFDPFTRKDVAAVLNAAGRTEDFQKDNDAWTTLGSGIRAKTVPAEGKGFYTAMLGGTSTPVPEVTVDPVPEVTVTPEPSTDAPARRKVEVKPTFGVFWTPDVTGSSDVLYGEDVGLRRIAVSQSNCFGKHSPRTNACQVCPLSSYCAQASVSDLPSIAKMLDAETAENIARAHREVAAPPPVAVPAPLDRFDKLLGKDPATANGGKPPAPATVPAAGVWNNPSLYPTGTTFIENSSFEGVCSSCKKEVLEGQPAAYLPGKGLYHPACGQAVPK